MKTRIVITLLLLITILRPAWPLELMWRGFLSIGYVTYAIRGDWDHAKRIWGPGGIGQM